MQCDILLTMAAGAGDVIVVGAGVVGAAVAYCCVRAGLTVTVVDRGAVAGGTTGRGEGNLLLSDKEPGPELDLALLSARLWREAAVEIAGSGVDIEYEAKGGLVVARTEPALEGLLRLAEAQRTAGVGSEHVTDPRAIEPHLAPGLAGAVRYPQDAQVNPMLAAAGLLHAARTLHPGRLRLRTGTAVTAVTKDASGRITGVRTASGTITADAVVNAAGTWGGEVAALAGVRLPIAPRRGFILVTEPLPRLIRHKVYSAEYVGNVSSDSAALETSAVVEGTASGPVLIGASRERVGFDMTPSVPVLRLLARQAVELFPVLADVRTVRTYSGFRPYCPDHLPVIGPDPRAPGLWHACGHEGAGIGLSLATGDLITSLLTGTRPQTDPHPFRPARFEEAA